MQSEVLVLMFLCGWATAAPRLQGGDHDVYIQGSSSGSAVHVVVAGLEWAGATGGLPDGAVEGGYQGNGNPLYVTRVLAPDGQYRPAKSHDTGDDARYAYNGNVEITSTFDFLVVTNEDVVILEWVSASGGSVPSYAVQGERNEYYVCRQYVPEANELVNGYVDTAEGLCKVPTQSLVWTYPEYEVLSAIPLAEF